MKLKAFTILESIITLALISIIISMVYLTIIYFAKNVGDYTSLTSKNFDRNLFSLMLKEDFFTSEKVTTHNKKDFIVHFYDGSMVNYYQSNNHLFNPNQKAQQRVLT